MKKVAAILILIFILSCASGSQNLETENIDLKNKLDTLERQNLDFNEKLNDLLRQNQDLQEKLKTLTEFNDLLETQNLDLANSNCTV